MQRSLITPTPAKKNQNKAKDGVIAFGLKGKPPINRQSSRTLQANKTNKGSKISESQNQSGSSSLNLSQDFFELGEGVEKSKQDSNQFYSNEEVEEKKNPYDLSVKEIEDLLIQK